MKRLFPNNVHMVERVFRFTLGTFVFSLIFWGPESLWGLLGLIPMATSLMGSCPLYTVLGVSTCNTAKPVKKSPGEQAPNRI